VFSITDLNHLLFPVILWMMLQKQWMKLDHLSEELWEEPVELCIYSCWRNDAWLRFTFISYDSYYHSWISTLKALHFTSLNRYTIFCKAACVQLKANTQSVVTSKQCEMMLLKWSLLDMKILILTSLLNQGLKHLKLP